MIGLSELLSNQALRLGDLLAARAQDDPAAPALHEGGAIVTRGGLVAQISAARARLEAAGLRPGDRVVVDRAAGGAALVLLLAVLAMDAVAVPVAPGCEGAARADLVARLQPRLVLHLPPAGTADTWPDRFLIEPGPAGVPEEAGLPSGRQPALILAVEPQGGGAVLSHRGLAWNAVLVAQERRYRDTDLLATALPLADAAALVEVLAMLHAGGACDLSAVSGRAPRLCGATALLMESVALPRLLAAPEAARGAEAGRLRLLALVGAVEESLAARTEAVIGLLPSPGLVCAEAAPVVAFARPGQSVPACGVGVPLPGVELRIVDAVGQPVPPGETGELLVRSTGAMLGYWRDPAATAACFAPGRFFRTGRRAARDADGHLVMQDGLAAPVMAAAT